MKFRRADLDEARAEAHRLALAFVAREFAQKYECREPEPDVSAPSFNRRKPITRWRVWASPIGWVGGDGWLAIDTETKQVEWKPWP